MSFRPDLSAFTGGGSGKNKGGKFNANLFPATAHAPFQPVPGAGPAGPLRRLPDDYFSKKGKGLPMSFGKQTQNDHGGKKNNKGKNKGGAAGRFDFAKGKKGPKSNRYPPHDSINGSFFAKRAMIEDPWADLYEKNGFCVVNPPEPESPKIQESVPEVPAAPGPEQLQPQGLPKMPPAVAKSGSGPSLGSMPKAVSKARGGAAHFLVMLPKPKGEDDEINPAIAATSNANQNGADKALQDETENSAAGSQPAKKPRMFLDLPPPADEVATTKITLPKAKSSALQPFGEKETKKAPPTSTSFLDSLLAGAGEDEEEGFDDMGNNSFDDILAPSSTGLFAKLKNQASVAAKSKSIAPAPVGVSKASSKATSSATVPASTAVVVPAANKTAAEHPPVGVGNRDTAGVEQEDVALDSDEEGSIQMEGDISDEDVAMEGNHTAGNPEKKNVDVEETHQNHHTDDMDEDGDIDLKSVESS
ncbi:unnamed protein product [Amoebophrya sp. A120]|nr:unnamed protein product [Amoebophrya sp. A120]|eukprot:GSA120T00002789001.1